ncbi:unnamed protein product [Mytilus coruscus]|uniref:Uncharacterized protein n=1 Tax=Mytilus coruscus TaxID=42192 RepID=A0A6J8AWI1_MYTCO|nr:unnamed protein product [Mytilus coruscus]
MAASLPIFPSFSVHENNAEIRWRKWIRRLENLFIGLNIKDSKRQRSLLLHYAGEDVNEVFDTFNNTGEDFDAAKHKNCRGDFPHANKCPAFGKSCNSCKKLNHFAAVCRSKRDGTSTFKKVDNYEHNDDRDSSSDDGYVFGLRENTVNKVQKGQPKINMKINNSNVDILIDTGSSINVIDESTFENIKCKPKLSHADTRVFAYGSDKNLKLMGKFHATIETDHKITTAPVYVMKGRYGNLLCYDTSVDLSIVDMREPNKAILRSRHITPTLDDMILDLNGSKDYGDINDCFGVSSAAELFQNTLSNALEGLDGVRNISDDIIVFGRNQDEHDKRLEKLFARLKEKNLTLNKAKCEFNKNKLEFYGHIFSADGTSADPRKISAIRNTTIPKDVGLRYELTVVPVNDMEIILHDNKIVIPKDLQMRVIDLAHEGHQSIVRTKQLLREKVYFPKIDKLVEQTCKSCIPC